MPFQMNDLLLNGGEMSDGQREPTRVTVSSNMMAARASSTFSGAGLGGGNTFNIHTILPPSSNSDGTIGKMTNMSMLVQQPSSIIQGERALVVV